MRTSGTVIEGTTVVVAFDSKTTSEESAIEAAWDYRTNRPLQAGMTLAYTTRYELPTGQEVQYLHFVGEAI